MVKHKKYMLLKFLIVQLKLHSDNQVNSIRRSYVLGNVVCMERAFLLCYLWSDH